MSKTELGPTVWTKGMDEMARQVYLKADAYNETIQSLRFDNEWSRAAREALRKAETDKFNRDYDGQLTAEYGPRIDGGK